MKITSDFKFDHPAAGKKSGSYEWWYFDAADSRNEWHIVVIFYDGCPFSTRYNRAWAGSEGTALPENHPAVSISLYHKGEPVFYSMSEYLPEQASFSAAGPNKVKIRVGENEAELQQIGTEFRHEVKLDEQLPSGDRLEGKLTFVSEAHPGLFGSGDPGDETAHGWNLTQPRADVSGRLMLRPASGSIKEIEWQGSGYHDHNTGSEPMKQQFRDWYWGRFHFESHTLIYYLMNTGRSLDYKGWLLDNQNKIKATLTQGKTDSPLSNMFLLSCARNIHLEKPDTARVMIQQSHVLDSGPFYYRFRSDAILHLDREEVLEQATGITEYIRPSRIHAKLFWPLVHMRYRYAENPHWVQRSPSLYRWTW